jgi:hypothetical protein
VSNSLSILCDPARLVLPWWIGPVEFGGLLGTVAVLFVWSKVEIRHHPEAGGFRRLQAPRLATDHQLIGGTLLAIGGVAIGVSVLPSIRLDPGVRRRVAALGSPLPRPGVLFALKGLWTVRTAAADCGWPARRERRALDDGTRLAAAKTLALGLGLLFFATGHVGQQITTAGETLAMATVGVVGANRLW